jgi:hypothetical protein
MALADRLAATALRLITKHGRAITVRQKNNTPDVAQPWKLTGTTNTDQPAIGAFFENTLSDLEIALGQVLGAPEGARSNLSIKGTRCLIPASGLTFPIVSENVIIDATRTWEIIDVELIQPGPTPVMYICILGR